MKNLINAFPKNDWLNFFLLEKSYNYFSLLNECVRQAYLNFNCNPKFAQIFNAFALCTLQNLKVVILGQDPYFSKGQADGLAFSCGKSLSPSMRNIIKNLHLNFPNCSWKRSNHQLIFWANQGILLLNCSLTVKINEPCSHVNFGWQFFINNALKYISQQKTSLVVLLWGNYAHKKSVFFNKMEHLVIKTSHPSPLSAYKGFLKSLQFKQTNQFLKSKQLAPINWF